MWVDCICMELVVASWFTRKWLKFYQTIRNLFFGDLVIPLVIIRQGVTWLRKDQGRDISSILVWGKRGEETVWFSVCGAPLDDWANSGYDDVLFTCREFGFSSLGSWSYSKEWIWNLGAISMLHCFRKVKCQQGDTAGI